LFNCEALVESRGRITKHQAVALPGSLMHRIVHCVVGADDALARVQRRLAVNPLRRARGGQPSADAAAHARSHRSFDRVSVDAPWIEVDTTDGYAPGLDEIVAFINA